MVVAQGPWAPNPNGYAAPVPINTPWARHCFILPVVMSVIASIFVALRFYSRRMKGLPFEGDDWFALLAVVFYYVHAVISMLMVVLGGAGHDLRTLTPDDITTHLKLALPVQVAYALTLACSKTSILLMFRRIFSVSLSIRYGVRALLVLVALWACAAIALGVGSCSPFAYNWDKTIKGGTCVDLKVGGTAVAASETPMNFILWIMPLPKVWKLQMQPAAKIALSAIFALGIIDVLAGVLRIVAMYQVDLASDWTISMSRMYFYSSLEAGLAIIVACAPILKPIVARTRPLRNLRSDYALSSGNKYRTSRYSYIVDEHNPVFGNVDYAKKPMATVMPATTASSSSYEVHLTEYPKGVSVAQVDSPRLNTPNDTADNASIITGPDVIKMHRDVTVEEETIGRAA